MPNSLTRRDLLTRAAAIALGVGVAGHPLGTLLTQKGFGGRRQTSLPLTVGAYCGEKNYPDVPPETKAEERARVTALLGGRLPVERNYFPWDAPVQAAVPSISTWAFPPEEVIAGDHDAEITQMLQENPAIRWTCNDHEPDQPGRPYTPAQYVEAAQHFYTVAKAANPGVRVGTILMQWSVVWGGVDWTQYYPGDDYTDYLGWDVYFEPWQGSDNSAQAMFDPIIAINASIGKPMIIPEFGIGVQAGQGADFTDDQKNTYLTETLALLTTPGLGARVDAFAWFYTNKSDGDWTLDNFPITLATLAAAAEASPPALVGIAA